jgi:hypothetical protein
MKRSGAPARSWSRTGRGPSTRFSSQSTSRPWAAKATSVNRNASAVLLDGLEGVDHVALGLGHLLAVSSRTRPWMYTSRNGTSPMKWMPANIIRATQKKMMSKPSPARSWGSTGRDRRSARASRTSRTATGRAEPGVEHVLVLARMRSHRPCTADGSSHAATRDLAAVGAVPGGDPVAPPELAADAPVADVPHPREVGVLPLRRARTGCRRSGRPPMAGSPAASSSRTTGSRASAPPPRRSAGSGRGSSRGVWPRQPELLEGLLHGAPGLEPVRPRNWPGRWR